MDEADFMQWMRHHLGDYAKLAGHLDFVEDAALMRLLRAYLAREAALPEQVDRVQRLVSAHTEAEQRAVEAMLHEFFVLVPGRGWVNDWCETEVARATAISDSARERSAKGNTARWGGRCSDPNSDPNSEAAAIPDASLSHRDPRPKTQDPRPKKRKPPVAPQGADGLDDAFAAFWRLYPRKVAKKAAQAAWARLAPSREMVSAIVEALKLQCRSEQWRKDGGAFVPYPATWLNGCRWQDEPPKPAAPSVGALLTGAARAAPTAPEELEVVEEVGRAPRLH